MTAGMVFGLSGCSGNTSDDNSDNNDTGTKSGNKAYYVDSAVSNVDYTCGDQNGTTDANGTFAYEPGKACTFSVAGVPLRTVKADDVLKGKEIIEDDSVVARFLQSIDADNNLDNGIEISDDIIGVLKEKLNGNISIPSNPEDIASIVKAINDLDGTTEREPKTPKEVEAHLKKTAASYTKKILAGKTVYGAIAGDTEMDTLVFGKDFTHLTFKDDGGDEKVAITLEGYSYTTEGYRYRVIGQKQDYIRMVEISGDDSAREYRLYYDQKKAQDFMNGKGSSVSNLAKKAFEGKKLYVAFDYPGHKATTTYDFKGGHVSFTDSLKGPRPGSQSYKYIGDDLVYISGDKDIPSELDKVVEIKKHSVVYARMVKGKSVSKHAILYDNEADAKAHPVVNP